MALFLNGKQIDKEQVYADNTPMSANDSETIAEKFDGLNATNLPIESGSATNTKDYIDSGLSGKADTSTFSRKSVGTTTAISVSANTIDTQDFTVNDSNYQIVVGFTVSNSINFAIVQCYFENSTTVRVRVRNLANTTDSYQVRVYYI